MKSLDMVSVSAPKDPAATNLAPKPGGKTVTIQQTVGGFAVTVSPDEGDSEGNAMAAMRQAKPQAFADLGEVATFIGSVFGDGQPDSEAVDPPAPEAPPAPVPADDSAQG